MDVIIFAGGAGTRIRPLVASPLPKHLMPVGDRPLLYHVLQTAIDGGADRILLSLNGPRPELTIQTVTAFNLPVPIAYTHSDNAITNGPVHDLGHVAPWAKEEPVGIMFADAYFNVPIDFRHAPAPHVWTTLLDPDADASQFGQVETNGTRVIGLHEKPAVEYSRTILTGAMKLPFDLFARARTLCAGATEELHLGDLISTYVTDGALSYSLLPTGSFIDCGNRQAWHTAHLDRTSTLDL